MYWFHCHRSSDTVVKRTWRTVATRVKVWNHAHQTVKAEHALDAVFVELVDEHMSLQSGVPRNFPWAIGSNDQASPGGVRELEMCPALHSDIGAIRLGPTHRRCRPRRGDPPTFLL